MRELLEADFQLFILLPFYLWVFSIPTGYYISAEKGRGGLDGLLMGVFWGPFGPFLAVLMPNPERRLEPIWKFSSVVATTAGAFVLLTILGVLTREPRRDMPQALVAPVMQAAAPKAEAPRLVFDPKQSSQDPAFYYVVCLLGIAVCVLIFFYVLAPKRSQNR